MIDIAGLEAAHQHGGCSHHSCCAVNEESVNHFYIAEFPQSPAEGTRTASKKPGIELVDEIFTVKQRGKRTGSLLYLSRQIGFHHVQIPGGEYSRYGKP